MKSQRVGGDPKKSTGVNGSIDMSNHGQFFEISSKVGNSMKEVEQRIHNYIEDINGRKYPKKSNENESSRLDDGGMTTDYSMHDAKR